MTDPDLGAGYLASVNPRSCTRRLKADANYLQIIERVRTDCDFLVPFVIPEQTSFDTTASSSLTNNNSRREPYAGFFDRRFFLAPTENVTIREELKPSGSINLLPRFVHPWVNLRSIDSVMPGVDTTWEVEPLVKNVEDAEKCSPLPHRLSPPNFEKFYSDRLAWVSAGCV